MYPGRDEDDPFVWKTKLMSTLDILSRFHQYLWKNIKRFILPLPDLKPKRLYHIGFAQNTEYQ